MKLFSGALLTLLLFLWCPCEPLSPNYDVLPFVDVNGFCHRVPRNPRLALSPGDGGFQLQIYELPEEAGEYSFWRPDAQILSEFRVPVDKYHAPTGFDPGRRYVILVGQRASREIRSIEAVYLTAVPLGTAELDESSEGQGRFFPTNCSKEAFGFKAFMYNFPNQVAFLWTAPTTAWKYTVHSMLGGHSTTECLELRATVLPWAAQRVYYKDSGSLLKRFCPKINVETVLRKPSSEASTRPRPKQERAIKMDSFTEDPSSYQQKPSADDPRQYNIAGPICPLRKDSYEECCACGTASYHMTIKSNWRFDLHMEDWPSQASNGGKQPYWTSILALFSVNRTHNLVSFLTKLVPSPDWCTGLSRVNICLKNCTWPQRLSFDLAPWDMGLMTGSTYQPPEKAQPERVKMPVCEITPDWPTRMPFSISMDEMQPPHDRFDASGPFRQTRRPRRFASLGRVEINLIQFTPDSTCQKKQQDEPKMNKWPAFVPPSGFAGGNGCGFSLWSPWSGCGRIDPRTCEDRRDREYWSNRSSEQRTVRRRRIEIGADNPACANEPLTRARICSTEADEVIHECVPKEQDQAYGRRKEDPWDMAKLPATTTTSSTTTTTTTTTPRPPELCSQFQWNEWSACTNVTCDRPGITFRWRKFDSNQTFQRCYNDSDSYDLRACWPPQSGCQTHHFIEACLDGQPMRGIHLENMQPYVKKYHYNASMGSCQMVDFSPKLHAAGIQHNRTFARFRNIFDDEASCLRRCNGIRGNYDVVKATYSTAQSINLLTYLETQRRERICGQPEDMGDICYEFAPGNRWSYVASQGVCRPFYYSGCKGNGNNFPSEGECLTYCTGVGTFGARMRRSHCRYSTWSEWTLCSAACGKGIQTRYRHATDCQTSNSDLIQHRACFDHYC